MLLVKAVGSMEKSTVQGGTHGPRGLHGGASCLPQTVREAAAISLSKFLAFLEVSQAVQFREAVKLIAFVVTGGLGGKR